MSSSRRSERARRPGTPPDAHYELPQVPVSRAPPAIMAAAAAAAAGQPMGGEMREVMHQQQQQQQQYHHQEQQQYQHHQQYQEQNQHHHHEHQEHQHQQQPQPQAPLPPAPQQKTPSIASPSPSTSARITGRGKNWRAGIKGDIRFVVRDKKKDQVEVVYGTGRPLPKPRQTSDAPESESGGSKSVKPASGKKAGKSKGKAAAAAAAAAREKREETTRPKQEDIPRVEMVPPSRDESPREETPEKPREPWEIEDPVWTEFSQEYYEVVEQLPLEIHRNFALLRELDDQTQRQTGQLLELIRKYVARRLPSPVPHELDVALPIRAAVGLDVGHGNGNGNGYARPWNGVGGGAPIAGMGAPPPPFPGKMMERPHEGYPAGNGGMGALPVFGSHVMGWENSAQGPSGMAGGAERHHHHHQEANHNHSMRDPMMRNPGGDGFGTPMTARQPDQPSMPFPPILNLPAANHPYPPPPPLSHINNHTYAPSPIPGPNHQGYHAPLPPPPTLSGAERIDTLKTRQADMYAHSLIPAMASRSLLPSIGKLARDMLRSADEKVGIAIGTYNTVDRHIRSLDAALQAQQAALNLGIRQDTLPSKAITGASSSIHPGPDAGNGGHPGMMQAGGKADAPGGGDPSAEHWRLGGGGGGKLHDPRVRAVDALNVGVSGAGAPQGRGPVGTPQPIVLGYMAAHNFDLAVDPNEPRYCFCQNVSYGEMLGCENMDCPNGGWFHLGCLGMTSAPQGKWWCDQCRPNAGDASGQKRKKRKLKY